MKQSKMIRKNKLIYSEKLITSETVDSEADIKSVSGGEDMASGKNAKKYLRKAGFTMVELIAAVAILGVLAALSTVGVISYQRNLKQLEYDGIAREIFIAAQNHLTMAKTMGTLGNTGGSRGTSEEDSDSIYYYIIPEDSSKLSNINSDLGQMLPFAAIDETIRTSGSYVIRYTYKTNKTNSSKTESVAQVLDVFYSDKNDGKFGMDLGKDIEYADLLTYADIKATDDGNTVDNKSKRSNVNGKIIGWYGGEEASSAKTYKLETPSIKVVNAEKLYAEITNPNYNPEETDIDRNPVLEGSYTKLVIKGVSSGAEMRMILAKGKNDVADSNKSFIKVYNDKIYIILDDVTEQNWHFANIFSDTSLLVDSSNPFKPGEDIEIYAQVGSNKELSTIENSPTVRVNSLFAEVDDSKTAKISNIRHLENLDEKISSLNDTLNITKAEQISDMSWADFKKNIIETINNDDNTGIGADTSDKLSVYNSDSKINTNIGCYMPISPNYILSYNGGGHKISDIQVNAVRDSETSVVDGKTIYTGEAGLFGKPKDGSEIKNLQLVDFVINSDTNAGALAGTTNNVTVDNVVAYQLQKKPDASGTPDGAQSADPGDSQSGNTQGSNDEKDEKGTITAVNNAGGLIGKATGGSITRSGAALIVSATGTSSGTSDTSKGNAGGLIGTVETGTTIDECFSGGHTSSDKDNALYDADESNVAGTSSAGGLVGRFGGTSIANSYSTCSVKAGAAASGGTAGGFIGAATAGTIENCYSTGLVNGGTDNSRGAFAGSISSVSFPTGKPSYFYEIINEIDDTANGGSFTYLPALGSGGTADSEGHDHAQIKPFDESAETFESFAGTERTVAKETLYDGDLGKYYQNQYPFKTAYQLAGDKDSKTSDNVNIFVQSHYGDWPAPEIFVFNTK